jgi:hypothetical protein
VIATAALFAATQVVAQEEPVCPPTTDQAGPFTITLTDGSPSPTPSGDGWVWEYEITADKACKIFAIKEVLLTYPDCCGDDINILEPINPNIYPPCKPALPIRKWPMVCDDYTLKLRFTYQNKQDGKISITTDTSNIGINTFGIRTRRDFYVAAIGGPACTGTVIPVKNEPVSAETVFIGAEFKWKLLYDAAGNSNDAKCVPEEDCEVTTLAVDEIRFGDGFLDSLPIDEPFVAGSSPGCTYVRTRSGGVKRLCK